MFNVKTFLCVCTVVSNALDALVFCTLSNLQIIKMYLSVISLIDNILASCL